MSFVNVTRCSGWAASRDTAAIVKAQTKAQLVTAVTAVGGTRFRATFFALVAVVAIRHMGSIGGMSGRQDLDRRSPTDDGQDGLAVQKKADPVQRGSAVKINL